MRRVEKYCRADAILLAHGPLVGRVPLGAAREPRGTGTPRRKWGGQRPRGLLTAQQRRSPRAGPERLLRPPR